MTGQSRVRHRLDALPDGVERACLRTHKQAAERRLIVSRHAGPEVATAPANDQVACGSSSPGESKLFGLSANDAVANTSRAGQR